MSFFCFYEFLSVLKSSPYIRVGNAIFLTDFFWGCPTCKVPDNSVHGHSGPPHHRLAMTDRGIDCDSFIHPLTSMLSTIYENMNPVLP